MLPAPPITLSHCNYLNPTTLLPSVTDNTDCLMLTGHLLTPRKDLKEIPLGNIDFSWLTDDDSGKYHAGYVTATPFDVVEAATSPMATSAQQPELYALTKAYTLAKGRTANIYTDGRYAFGVPHDFEMLWEQCVFLTSSGNKI